MTFETRIYENRCLCLVIASCNLVSSEPITHLITLKAYMYNVQQTYLSIFTFMLQTYFPQGCALQLECDCHCIFFVECHAHGHVAAENGVGNQNHGPLATAVSNTGTHVMYTVTAQQFKVVKLRFCLHSGISYSSIGRLYGQ